MKYTDVYVPYVGTETGTKLLLYAADLASLLNARLHVLYQYKQHLPLVLTNKLNIEKIQRERIEKAVEIAVRGKGIKHFLSPTTANIRSQLYSRTSILVSGDKSFVKKDCTVIYPFGQTQVFKNTTDKNVFIPFGNREPSKQSIVEGIALAAQLGASITLFHATWVNPTMQSQNAEDHMDPSATKLLSLGKQLAKELIQNGTVDVEIYTSTTVPHVTDGISRRALVRGSNLLSLAHDERVVRGDYTQELIERSLTPVIAFAYERRGK